MYLMKLKSFNMAKKTIICHLDKAAGRRMRKDLYQLHIQWRVCI